MADRSSPDRCESQYRAEAQLLWENILLSVPSPNDVRQRVGVELRANSE